MAVLAGPNEKLDAAKFLENAEKPQYDKAVILYEKAGYAGKALELAFETKQHNVLQVLTTKPLKQSAAITYIKSNTIARKSISFRSQTQGNETLFLATVLNLCTS